MREVTEKQTRQLENLRKQRLVVYIREKDGRKCGFEAILINRLLEEGVTVQPLLENTGRALANGDTSSLNNGLLALVGTWWEVDMTHHDSEREFAHKMNAQHCDYRLLGMDEQRKGKILGAGSKRSRRWETALSAQIIEGLVATFPVDNE